VSLQNENATFAHLERYNTQTALQSKKPARKRHQSGADITDKMQFMDEICKT
jgi:hypothetical protein